MNVAALFFQLPCFHNLESRNTIMKSSSQYRMGSDGDDPLRSFNAALLRKSRYGLHVDSIRKCRIFELE